MCDRCHNRSGRRAYADLPVNDIRVTYASLLAARGNALAQLAAEILALPLAPLEEECPRQADLRAFVLAYMKGEV